MAADRAAYTRAHARGLGLRLDSGPRVSSSCFVDPSKRSLDPEDWSGHLRGGPRPGAHAGTRAAGASMETAVGVFASHERAEEAVRRLREHGIPEDRILYLTRSESEARSIGRRVE